MSLEKEKKNLFVYFLAIFVDQLYIYDCKDVYIKVMEGIEKAAWLRE